MATASQLEKALSKARAAGDASAVSVIARELRNMKSGGSSEKEIFPVELAEGVASGISGS